MSELSPEKPVGSEEITVVEWITYDDAAVLPESIGGLGGFFGKGMRWADYLANGADGTARYAEAIRRDVVAKGLRLTGDQHQQANGVPLFSDGTVGMFSFRAWGDIMAAIWAEHEDRDYHYMNFYM